MHWPCIEACRDIPAGMPLLTSYGAEFWDKDVDSRRVFAYIVLTARQTSDVSTIGSIIEVSLPLMPASKYCFPHFLHHM